jgi:predicted deacylase
VLRPDAATFAWRASAPARLVIGRSLDGREIVARRQGPADARRVVLLLGQMHGDEPRGRAVVRETRRLLPPPGVQVWTVSTMNPDGSVRGTRQNARRVDLNRNFPHRWRPTSTSRTYYPGRAAASEPETRQMMRFLDRLRPQLVVSLHQAYRSVDIGNPKSRRWAVRLARAFDLPTVVVPCRGPCAGTLAGWYNARYAGYAVTVELPRRVSTTSARRYARAVMSVAGLLAPTAAPTPSPTPTPVPTPVPTSTSSPTPTPSPTAT